MKTIRAALRSLVLLVLTVWPSVGPALAEDEVLDRVSSEQSFEVEAGTRTRLVVDNLFGRIHVRGHDAPRIDLKLVRVVLGRTDRDLERARREVTLDVTAERGLVDLYVNGPFRHSHRREWSRWHDPGYRVVYDFELSVPRVLDLELKTVDGGTIRVADVRGTFEVNNVNGGLEMSGIGGSGTAQTVNGPVRVQFASHPTGDSKFVTVNGDVEVLFRPGLNADLTLHSTFGELWTQFESRPLASRPPVERVEGGRRIIRTESGARVRVGGGGPSLTFETLNGDVLIRRADGAAELEETP